MQTETTPVELAAIDLAPGEIDRPPNYLYRYRAINDHLRQILVGNTLYYSSPKHFNDSLDCRIPTELSGSPDDVRSYCDQLMSERWPSMLPDEKNLWINRFISEDRWNNTAAWLQREVYKCGVLCLSERWDISGMWELYAQDHTGVCLEFLAADEKGLTDFGSKSFKVTYSDSEQIELNLLADDWEQVKQVLLTKSMKWGYEQEKRIISEHNLGESSVGNWLFPPEFLTSLIFGHKADDAIKRQVKAWLSEGKCSPVLYQAQPEGMRLTKKRIK